MTADRSAAADTLRDELAEALASYLPGHGSFGPQHWQGEADALLPVVRRYADAQVAAERERFARECEACIPPERDRDGGGLTALMVHLAAFARRQS